MDGVGAEFAACCADCVTPASCFQGSLGLQVASVHRLQVMGVSASGCVLLDFGVDGMGVADWADIAGGLRGELAASLGRWSWPSWQRSSGIQLNHAECLSYLALRSLVSSVVSGAPTSPALRDLPRCCCVTGAPASCSSASLVALPVCCNLADPVVRTGCMDLAPWMLSAHIALVSVRDSGGVLVLCGHCGREGHCGPGSLGSLGFALGLPRSLDQSVWPCLVWVSCGVCLVLGKVAGLWGVVHGHGAGGDPVRCWHSGSPWGGGWWHAAGTAPGLGVGNAACGVQ